MTQQNPTFNISEFELRGYTNPYLSPAQRTKVEDTEIRVNAQLDFLGQMLGWNGANYWSNLVSSVNQKRQLLGGSFGVYNSYIIPRVYEVRNWNDTFVIDRLQFVEPGRPTQVIRVVVGNESYQIESVEVEGDKYIVSIGTLTQTFLDAIAAGDPILVDIPTYRPAPFYRPQVGIAGDFSFICGFSGSDLVLYPSYDTQRQFPFRFPTLIAGSTYYFDQPIYLSLDSSLSPEIQPTYDADLNLWYFQIPDTIETNIGLTAFLAWANSNATQADNYSVEVLIQSWTDPSDWGSPNVLNNFKGVWNNKGGDLPYNFVFDSLSIHGFNEKDSVLFEGLDRSLDFNDIVNFIYYQRVTTSPLAPPGAKVGDLWWNDATGVLAVWLLNEGSCGDWVEIDYRQTPTQTPPPAVVFTTVAAWSAAIPTLPTDAIVRIDDISGLGLADNVIGVQGTLSSPAQMTLHRMPGTTFWIADEFVYATAADFAADARLLPFQVPVILSNADTLEPTNLATYEIQNLSVTIQGEYSVTLRKFYTDTTWEMYPDSILKYIANTSLFNRRFDGEMWWDYANTVPTTRAASIYYSSPAPLTTVLVETPGIGLTDGVYTNVNMTSLSGTGGQAQMSITVAGGTVTVYSVTTPGDFYSVDDLIGPDPATFPNLVGCTFVVTGTTTANWVAVNMQPQSGPPAPILDLGVVLFYCNGVLLQSGTPCVTDDFIFTFTQNAVNGTYDYQYQPLTFLGKVQFPTITISDALTTAYRADITALVFSGIEYYMSPNVFNAETPLRLWKQQDLQVADTLAHLAEDNYSNPLIADVNGGVGPDNWERYFIRLPLEYGRNQTVWQKVALTAQDFGYWGSSIEPEQMRCPPEDDLPAIYEELFLYDQPVADYTYVYSEPYFYSNIAGFSSEIGDYRNATFFPGEIDHNFDQFSDAEFVDYEPLHNRQADVTSPVNQGYGNWLGEYVNINPCIELTGFFTTDLIKGGIDPIQAPIWDASIYKFAPTCENEQASYAVDANHYKISYAYFVADASAAEDAFFDIQQEIAWRYPETQPKTSYLLPR